MWVLSKAFKAASQIWHFPQFHTPPLRDEKRAGSSSRWLYLETMAFFLTLLTWHHHRLQNMPNGRLAKRAFWKGLLPARLGIRVLPTLLGAHEQDKGDKVHSHASKKTPHGEKKPGGRVWNLQPFRFSFSYIDTVKSSKCCHLFGFQKLKVGWRVNSSRMTPPNEVHPKCM